MRTSNDRVQSVLRYFSLFSLANIGAPFKMRGREAVDFSLRLGVVGIFVLGGLLTSCGSGTKDPNKPIVKRVGEKPKWDKAIREEVRPLGAGNWVVVADAGFPVHSRKGVKVIVLDAEAPKVLNEVLIAIDEMPQVEPRFSVTRELRGLRDSEVRGIESYRVSLDRALSGYGAQALDAHSLMAILEDASSKFAVLVIKTRTKIPYSAVFCELDSGYWDGQAERRLRERLEKKSRKKKP